MKPICLIVIFLLSAAPQIRAQQTDFPVDTVNVTGDTLESPNVGILSADAYYVDIEDTAKKGINATEALFRSLFVPGWGQFSNGSYIKGGIILIVESTLIGTIAHYENKRSDAREAFMQADESEKAVLFAKFQDAENDRNRFIWFLGATIFLSMFDAYVDAHLADFPEPEKGISLDIGPDKKNILAVRLNYNF